MSTQSVEVLPLSGIRVVELATQPSGELTGRALAQLGANVTKLVPEANRRCDTSDAGFAFYNHSKTLNEVSPSDCATAELVDLVSGSDCFICDLQPAELAALGLDLSVLAESCDQLIILAVTPFGLDGPYADWHSSDLVALAMGGVLVTCGYDDHSIPPIRPSGNQGFHTAASFALMAFGLALIERQVSGTGQLIDVSMHHALAVTVERSMPYWHYQRQLVERQTCRHALPFPSPPTIFATQDRRFVLCTLIYADDAVWRRLNDWLEALHAPRLSGPDFDDGAYRAKHSAEIYDAVQGIFANFEAAKLYHSGQEHGIPIGVLNQPEDLLVNDHLADREVFGDVEVDGRTTVRAPRFPVRFFCRRD